MGTGLRHWLPAAVAAIALSGCGDATPTPDDNAGAAAATFLLACAEGEAVAALENLTEPVRSEFVAAPDVRSGCARVLNVPPPIDEETLHQAEVAEVDVNGGFAHIVIQLPTGERPELEGELVAGNWLLANPPVTR